MKVRNILVPLDFSNCSENALRYAIDLGNKIDARLTLLHSYYVQVPVADMAVAVDFTPQVDFEAEAHRSFDQLKKDVPELQNIEYDTSIRVGFVTDAVIQELEGNRYDLVVMGTKGCSNKLDEFLGSNAYSVLKNVKAPVLVVPENKTFQGLKKIALAADYHHLRDLNALEVVKSLAILFESEIHLLHISSEPSSLAIEEATEALALRDFFKGFPLFFDFRTEGNIVEGIENFVMSEDIDLTVFVTHPHTIFEKLFKRRITRASTLHAQITSLVVHD